MNKAKKRKLEAEAERGGAPAPPPGWGTEILVIAFAVGAVLGTILGFNLGRDRSSPVPAPAATLQQPAQPSAPADAYGRTPDHEHYGHDHP
jgi:hypothetical protein